MAEAEAPEIEEEEEECPKCPPVGAPAWMATFADMATLLMAFFVLILSFAEFNVPKFKQISGSLRNAFGVQKIVPIVEQPKGTTVLSLNFSPSPAKSVTNEMGVVPKTELEKLAKGLVAHPNVYILSDEIYSRILFDENEHVSLKSFPEISDRVIVLDGWSKTYSMTGWRLGYGIYPNNIYSYAEKLAINCHSCVNSATQFAGIEALRGDQTQVKKMIKEFKLRRDYLVNELNSIENISCLKPGGAFYVFPNINKDQMNSAEISKFLLENKFVATVPDGVEHYTSGDYVFGPDVTENYACEQAMTKGKKDIIQQVSPEVLTAKTEMNCSLKQEQEPVVAQSDPLPTHTPMPQPEVQIVEREVIVQQAQPVIQFIPMTGNSGYIQTNPVDKAISSVVDLIIGNNRY